MICKPFFYRAAAYMNAMSLFGNLLLFILIEAITNKFIYKSFAYFFSLYAILFAIKICVSQLLVLQIAYFRNPKYHFYQVFMMLLPFRKNSKNT